MARRAILGICLIALMVPRMAHADPSALWHIIEGKCVPDQQAHNDPSPCAAVDISHGVASGWVLLKDRDGIAQFLVMPTARISGIEDPAILKPDAFNYWGPAWQARTSVEARLKTALRRDEISLAINSAYGRSQDQLHIHVDCLRQDVLTAIRANIARVGMVWAPFPVALAGHPYRAMRVDGDTLADANPFRLLAADPDTAADMGHHTLVVVGETFADGKPGFLLLDGKADRAAGNFGSGEELQDHACAIAHAS